MKEMSSRPAPWSDKRHIRVADKPVSQPEVLVQPGPGQAALKLGGLLFGECLLTDESTVKSWGDNRAQGPGFLPRSVWPTLCSVSLLMALPPGSEVLWCGGVGRLVSLFPPLAETAVGLLDPIKASPGVAALRKSPRDHREGFVTSLIPTPIPQRGLSAHGNSPAGLGCLAPGDRLGCTLPLSTLWWGWGNGGQDMNLCL